MLSEEERRTIDHEVGIVPQKRSACIGALLAVQRRRRWISDETLREVAAYLDMSPTELDAVATFYNHVYRQPVGRHVIRLCDSVTCWIEGYEDIEAALEDRLGVRRGETTGDGRFTLLPVQCLGCCEAAPALMIDDDLHTGVRAGTLEELLERYP